MNLISYLDRRVHVVLTNDFYYVGLVLDADESSLTLKDKNGNLVSLKKEVITSIVEVQNGQHY